MLRPSFALLATASLLAACSDDPAETEPGTSSTSSAGGSTAASTTTSTTGAGAGGSGTGGAAPVPCATGDAEIETLPACGSDPGSDFEVKVGCEPIVDGILHAAEWADGTCFDVPAMAGGSDMVVSIKLAGDAVYMATSGLPTCGCGMLFYFDPEDAPGQAGNEFVISVFDDPFGTNGDMSAFKLEGGMLTPASPPAGVITRCPGNQPSPIRYEWRLPYEALGIVAGAPDAYRMAIIHADAHWPASLATNPQGVADQPDSYGRLSSPTWK